MKKYDWNQFQYVVILVYFILSLFKIDLRFLLIATGGLTIIMMFWMNAYPVRVSGLGIATHTYLILGALGALLNIIPILLLYGSYHASLLFFLIVLIFVTISIRAKKLIKKKLLFTAVCATILLSVLPQLFATLLAILTLIIIIHLEAIKYWDDAHTTTKHATTHTTTHTKTHTTTNKDTPKDTTKNKSKDTIKHQPKE